MQFACEKYSSELVAEMLPLWKAHYEEIAAFKDIPLDPDIAAYEQLDKLGCLRIYTVRLGPELVGYQVLIVAQNPHYRTSKQANQDILYLSPELRKGLAGYKFIKWCDKELKFEGVQITYQHVKVAHDFTPMLERLGYQRHDIVMTRRL